MLNLKCYTLNKPKMFSYLPLRTYVLPLLIIGSIFSLKAQEEQTIKRYRGWKMEFGIPFTRFSVYDENPGDIANPLDGSDIGEDIVETRGKYGFGILYFAPQYYIHNNISVGFQYEFDAAYYNTAHIFMGTSHCYLGNGAVRPSLGLGLGLNFHKRTNIDDISNDVNNAISSFFSGNDDDDEDDEDEEEDDSSFRIRLKGSRVALAISPRFKLHIGPFLLHLSYDINIHRKVPNGWRFGMALTGSGKKK